MSYISRRWPPRKIRSWPTRNGRVLGSLQTMYRPGAWTDAGATVAPATSIVSGANLRWRDGSLEPRPHLTSFGAATGGSNESVAGVATYNDIGGNQLPVVFSQNTLYELVAGSWSAISYVQNSGQSVDDPPNGAREDLFFADTVYLPRVDDNILVFTNGINAPFCWAGPLTEPATFSTLTGAPIARDVTVFDNRPILWNILDGSLAGTRFVTRVQWSAAGDPEEWDTSEPGVGFVDLVDMRGEGTRIFTLGQNVLLFSTEEIWVGRQVGLPFVFQFQPLRRNIGLPYPRAAINTRLGIFWLGEDDNIWLIDQNLNVQPVGTDIQRELHEKMQPSSKAESCFGFDEHTNILTFFYRTASAQKAFSLNVSAQAWTPELYDHYIDWTLTGPSAANSAQSTWNDLTSTYAANTATFQDYSGYGYDDEATPMVITSFGTAYSMSSSQVTDVDVLGDATDIHEAWFGVMYDDELPNEDKLVTRIRLNLTGGDSASTVSVGIAEQPGGTIRQMTQIAVPANSFTSQFKVDVNVSAAYPSIVVRSLSGSNWQLDQLGVELTRKGRSFD